MSKANRRPGATPPGQAPAGRPPLAPADPLPPAKALIQVAVLLGIPLALLFVIKQILRQFFPELGY